MNLLCISDNVIFNIEDVVRCVFGKGASGSDASLLITIRGDSEPHLFRGEIATEAFAFLKTICLTQIGVKPAAVAPNYILRMRMMAESVGISRDKFQPDAEDSDGNVTKWSWAGGEKYFTNADDMNRFIGALVGAENLHQNPAGGYPRD